MFNKQKIKKAKDYLDSLKRVRFKESDFAILDNPKIFTSKILELIESAEKRIIITALYLEKDEAGDKILRKLFEKKRDNPAIDIKILVDWHRAQRGRIGEKNSDTNADFYYQIRRDFGFVLEDTVEIYGIPVNTREVFGVLHFKGFVFDNNLLYSGASINNVYCYQFDKYRLDRYHLIKSGKICDAFYKQICDMVTDEAVQRLDVRERLQTSIFTDKIKSFRKKLAQSNYQLADNETGDLTITALNGVRKKDNVLNKTIESLFYSTEKELILFTPYFNFPKHLKKAVDYLLKKGKKIEIFVGDKTANDFYVKPDDDFHLSSVLPYLYEKNLRSFCKKYQKYIDNGSLIVNVWKDGENSYHLKGMFVDHKKILLTGNNLNPRAWNLDAENGILIFDNEQKLLKKMLNEKNQILKNTHCIKHYEEIETLKEYSPEVKKVLKRLARVQLDRLAKFLL